MRLGNLGLAALGILAPALLALYSCGSSGSDSSGNGGNGNGAGEDGGGLNLNNGDDGGNGGVPVNPVDAGFCAPDDPSCSFPPIGAPPCAGGAPPIHVVYPPDGVLVPPNMNAFSVQWTPYGSGFQAFEVDFNNAVTNVRVVTKCAAQTVDTEQPPKPSGGCELAIDPNMWSAIANVNSGGDPVTITVRGTTDGTCASPSASSVKLSFAHDDMLGAIYYWKSTISSNGVGGQVWVKSFGDSTPEKEITTNLKATCNGCHALSRDGLRMAIYSDDDDSDDEYGDVTGSLIDMTTRTAIGGQGSMGPGFSSFAPDHSEYVASDGDARLTPNAFGLLDGNTAALKGAASNIGATGARPTMPDWSPDGTSIVFTMPQQVASWTNAHGSPLVDDDHTFGGSLYTLPYKGSGQFGAPAVLLQSGGENNYYPGYSPDGQLVVFDRAPLDNSAGSLTGCKGTPPQASCPNDSFSNPAARVMVMRSSAGATPVDLELANGSPAASPSPTSNSWPKWSPFLQSYKGDTLLWIAFSSTRDYGLRVRNHQPGMFQCYPADSYEDPGAAHHQAFQSTCQQPQLWMAAIDVTKAVSGSGDPSHVAFWLPFQDISTHNHTPQWTQSVAGNQPDAGACIPSNGNCQTNPGGCCSGLACNGSGTCTPVIR